MEENDRLQAASDKLRSIMLPAPGDKRKAAESDSDAPKPKVVCMEIHFVFNIEVLALL
jgi:hypothetical protein